MVQLICGPVIGLVTSTSARILVETDAPCTVTCTLTFDDQTHKETCKLTKGRPFVLQFQRLTPATPYALTITGIPDITHNWIFSDTVPHGIVKTLPAAPSSLRFMIASCDKGPGHRGSLNLITKFDTEYRDKVDIVIRHGDQVYADSAYKKSLEKLSTLSFEEMYEEYAKIYRTIWTASDIRRVYASVPHLMLPDDHEIRNDWGTQRNDTDPTSDTYKVALAGKKAYGLYQRQLWDESFSLEDYVTGRMGTKGLESRVHVFDGVAVVCMENRMARSFGYVAGWEAHETYLGAENWTFLRKIFGTEGVLSSSKIRALIVVHSMPVALFGSKGAKILGAIPPQRDKAGFGLYVEERVEYLSLLVEWKRAGEGRDLVLVGGDMHFGVLGKVVGRDTKTEFAHMVTSAISNSPPPLFVYKFVRFCAWVSSKIGRGLSIRHRRFVYERNFAIVEIDISGETTELALSLVTGSGVVQ